MNRSLQVLLGVCVLLAAGLVYGMSASSSQASATSGGAKRLAVKSATGVCQDVGGSATGSSTLISGYVPTGTGSTGAGTAPVTYAATTGRTNTSVLALTKPGVSVTNAITSVADTQNGDTVLGQASGAMAPGFTLDQTLDTTVGPARGLAGRTCEAPGTDFWFPGVQGAQAGANAFLYLSNTSSFPATFSITLYGANGEVNVQGSAGLNLAADKSTSVLIGTLDNGTTPVVAVHVQVSVGTLAAAMLDQENAGDGNDFVPAAAAGTHLVIPGIPASKVRQVTLYLLAPSTDADVSLHWIGQGTIVPANNATVAT